MFWVYISKYIRVLCVYSNHANVLCRRTDKRVVVGETLLSALMDARLRINVKSVAIARFIGRKHQNHLVLASSFQQFPQT